MKTAFKALSSLLLCALLPAHAADSLPLTAAQQAHLGIALVTPGTPQASPALTVPARVVLPPSSVRVIAAAGAALVTQIHVQAGESVKRDAPLVTLSMPGLADAQNAVTQARLRAALAANQAARDRKLFAEGLIAESRLRTSESEVRSAEASLAAAQAGRAALGQGSVSGSALTLTAPMAGVVAESLAEPGLRVDAGMALMKLADMSKLALDIPLSPQQAKGVLPGQRVKVRDSEASGRITVLLPQLNAAQSVLVRASLDDPQRRLRPGQAVQVELLGTRAEAGRVVPASALVWKAGAPYVFVETPRGFVPTPVQVRQQNSLEVELTGVAANARVVVKGVAALKSKWLGE